MHTGVFTTDAGRRRQLLIYGVIWIVQAVGIGLIAGSIAIVAPNLRLFSLALFVGFVLIIYPGVVGTSFLLGKTTARAKGGPGSAIPEPPTSAEEAPQESDSTSGVASN